MLLLINAGQYVVSFQCHNNTLWLVTLWGCPEQGAFPTGYSSTTQSRSEALWLSGVIKRNLKISSFRGPRSNKIFPALAMTCASSRQNYSTCKKKEVMGPILMRNYLKGWGSKYTLLLEKIRECQCLAQNKSEISEETCRRSCSLIKKIAVQKQWHTMNPFNWIHKN